MFRGHRCASSPAEKGVGDPDRAGPVAVYLALPVQLFPVAIATLAAVVDLPPGSRIVVEKPFGEDLGSAVTLNGLLDGVLSGASHELGVYRVDHALGMATVQNFLGRRFGNRVLSALWSSEHIAQVEVLWEETLALEGRAGYYDQAGALKDVMQNHMMQVLCLVAMEPPAGPHGIADLHDLKVDVLRSIRAVVPSEVAARRRRARYTAGRLAGGVGRVVPSYVDEDGVDAARSTETFAELILDIDSLRWSGTPFLLRAGKALGEGRKGILVRFRDAAPLAAQFERSRRRERDRTLGLAGAHARIGHSIVRYPWAGRTRLWFEKTTEAQ